MTREEALKLSMKEKDTQLLKILATSPEGIGKKDIKTAALEELKLRGETK
jgi:hypothetical protein